jgi:very-short-patch-repair endonuclease
MGRFILDFWCAEYRLAVEIDGEYQNQETQQARDTERDNHLRRYGVQLLRFTNQEVESEVENVLQKIRSTLSQKDTRESEGLGRGRKRSASGEGGESEALRVRA